MLRVGIISYFPDTDIREKRIKIVNQTLEDLRSVIPNDVNITIIAQNYNEYDENDVNRFNYIFHSHGLGQCEARNELLRSFYNSDDDFMLYTDDDTAFYDRYCATELFSALHTNPEWFDKVDCFTGLEGRFTPFTEENQKLGLDNKWVFKPMQFATSGEFRVLKNLKKYYGLEYYYDSGHKYGEDLHFRLTKLSKINSFVCRNIICKSRGLIDDICTLDRMTKQEQEAKYAQVTLDIYEELGIQINASGKPDLNDFRCKIPYLAIYKKDGTASTVPGPQTKRLF